MSEFKTLQKLLKLNNKDVAELFKVHERTITRWRLKDAPESVLMNLRAKANVK